MSDRGKKATGNLRALVDPKLVSALSHPLRVHILNELSEAMASPSDLARSAGLSVNYVAYHVKELEKIGYVELVKTEPRRGTVEHYYQARRRFLLDDEEWERLPAPLKAGLSASLCQAIVQDMSEALAAGTFEMNEDHHLSRTNLLVDERGWSDLVTTLHKTLDRVLAIQEECAERLREGGKEGLTVEVAMISFGTAKAAAAAESAPE